MTKEIKNVYQRLHAVMTDVSYVQKENKKVNKQYTFVSHDAVTSKVRAALVEHGLLSTTTVLEFTQDGNRTTARVKLTFINIDEPSELVSVESFGYGIDPQDKGPGKAVSYAVKYGLLKTFMLETGDDPEQDNIEHKPGENLQKQPAKQQNPTDSNPFEKSGLSPAQQAYRTIYANLFKAVTEQELQNVWANSEANRKALPDDGQAGLQKAYSEKRETFKQAA